MDGGSQSADLWRLTLQHSPIGMVLVGLDGRLLMVNRAMCEMLGYSDAELCARKIRELTHPDDLGADLGQLARAVAGELDSFRLLKRYLHATGRVVWGDLSAALVRGPDGAPQHFIAQILDVTDQREAAGRIRVATESVERERQTLEAIFETVNVGLLLIDSDGHYERMNRHHEANMKAAFPDGHAGVAGQVGEVFLLDGTTLMPQEQLPTYRASRGEEFDDITYWVGSDPETRTALSVSARQVRGPRGERRGAVLAYQEITDLLRAITVQDEFVSSMSHELRTPLSSMLGYLELLVERPGLPSEVRDQLGIVQRNGARLGGLLTDLLLVGQASESSLQLDRSCVDLVAVVGEAVQAVLPRAEQADVSVKVVAPDQMMLTIDGQRIRQVVDNLLSNALKYGGESGSILLTLSGDDTTVELTVTDAGVGIAPGDEARVFDRFFRGANARDEQVPGTGLGLNIVRSIVEAHGGTISVDSEPGRGSTFRVLLPQRDRRKLLGPSR